MRDSYVNIDGHGLDKINHAYAFGKSQLAIKTLNEGNDYAIKSNDKKIQLYIHQSKSYVYLFKSDFKNVIVESEQAISLIYTINDNKEFKEDLIGLQLQKSQAYSELGMFDFAKRDIVKIKKITKNDKLFIPSILMSEYQLYGK